MYTHLPDEEEAVVEVVEGEWEGVEVHAVRLILLSRSFCYVKMCHCSLHHDFQEMDTWSTLMVGGRVTMLLLMQAMGMLTMLLLMRAMVMHVVEAVVSGAVAGEVATVASLIISKMEGEVAMVASMIISKVASVIISKMEGITTRHQHHPEVEVVVSGAVAGEVAMVAMVASPSLIISKMEGIMMRHLLEVGAASFHQICCMHTSPVELLHLHSCRSQSRRSWPWERPSSGQRARWQYQWHGVRCRCRCVKLSAAPSEAVVVSWMPAPSMKMYHLCCLLVDIYFV